MTGAFVRIKRNDKMENVEIEHLTDAERKEFFSKSTPEEILKWLNFTCEILNAIEEQQYINEGE